MDNVAAILTLTALLADKKRENHFLAWNKAVF